jgi:hypothetical protein
MGGDNPAKEHAMRTSGLCVAVALAGFLAAGTDEAMGQAGDRAAARDAAREAGRQAAETRHDPFGGYRQRATHREFARERHDPTYQPRTLRPEPLIGEPRQYRNAHEPRVIASATTSGLQPRHNTIVDRPARTVAVGDTGGARVVHRDPVFGMDRTAPASPSDEHTTRARVLRNTAVAQPVHHTHSLFGDSVEAVETTQGTPQPVASPAMHGPVSSHAAAHRARTSGSVGVGVGVHSRPSSRTSVNFHYSSFGYAPIHHYTVYHYPYHRPIYYPCPPPVIHRPVYVYPRHPRFHHRLYAAPCPTTSLNLRFRF